MDFQPAIIECPLYICIVSSENKISIQIDLEEITFIGFKRELGMQKRWMGFLFLMVLQLSSLANTAHAIQENEYRLGLLAGNIQLGGKQASLGSGLGYGLNFGYMFSDDMLFNLDFISGTVGKDFTHSQTGVGVSYYFAHHNTAFYNVSGGMSIANNKITVGTESVTGGGSGFYLGLGLDFDLGRHFVAGFSLRYNALTQVKRTTDLGVEVVAIDSFTATLLKLAYVF